MKIHDINRFFKKFGEFQVRFRWLFILFALILVGLGVSGMKKIRMENSRDNWFDDSEQIEIETEEFEEQFGNNEGIIILVEADDVFHPEVLKAIKKLGDELLDKVPYADEITSIMDMEISIGTEEGIEVINPFEDGIPDDPKKLQEIKELILSRKSLRNKLISDDFTETVVSLSLLEFPEEEEWKKVTDIDPLFQVGEVAIPIVTDSSFTSDLYTFKAAGMPYTETEERDFFAKEMKMRVLSGFGVMILLLLVFLRSARGVFVPVFTTVTGIIVVFGIMGLFGIGVDSNMVTLPVLLGMALSVGYSLHLVNSFKYYFKTTGKRKESVIAAVEETGWPIFFTALTTMGSVMSFATAGIVTIKWLGFTCASVVFADYLFVIILVPVLMSFGRDKKPGKVKVKKDTVVDKLMIVIGNFVIKRKKQIMIVFTILVIVIAPGVRLMTVDMDVFGFMGTKVPYVKRVYDVTQSQLGSYLSYNISIQYDDVDVIKDPEVLKGFDTLLDSVRAFELTKSSKDNAAVFSILDIIKEMNQTLHSDSVEYYTIPESRDLIAQILLLYEMSGGTKTFRWIDEDYSMLRAQVQVYKFTANEITRELEAIKRISAEELPGATVSIIGSAVQFAELNGKIVTGEIKSILVALFVIGLLMIVVFGSLKTGLIGMIPNLSPLIAIAGYMGYFNSPLDMMTMTIMPMLLGIAVDDTIHFINHIKYEFERQGNYEKAILSSLKMVGKTLGMTTIVLSATFAMYIFSPISNMVRIGFLASLGLIVALLIDYLVTPALILLTKPYGKDITDKK